MSKEKRTKKTTWGGARQDSGRNPKVEGGMTKICVSVGRNNWQSALSKWNAKPSWLVDRLISAYIEGGIKGREAA
jgi:hypothetical protein